MTKKLLLIAIVFLGFVTQSLQVFGQAQTDSLFDNQVPLEIGLNISIREIKKSNGDSTWTSNKLYFRTEAGLTDSIKVDMKSRGHFRLANCYFPPLWIKIDKKAA